MKNIFLVILFLSFELFAQKSATRYTKSRIFFDSNKMIEELINQGISADDGIIKKDTYIESIFSTVELDKAKSLGYKVEVLIEDMQKHYIENVRDAKSGYYKNPIPCQTDIIDYTVPANFNLGSMGGFLTYSQMLDELDEMQNLYPDLITLKTQIGTFNTVENRPIYWVKISDNPGVDEIEPEILYTAIHHAREPASMQQLIFYMWYLLENYATDASIQTLVDNTEMYFIPVINVDGYLYNESTNPSGGGLWRKNRRDNGDGYFGVDLNRNYSYEWGGLGTGPSNSPTYPGVAGFSEPETQAIKWFCEEHEFTMALNNHTFSQLLLYPFGYDYNIPTPDDATFKAISSLMVSQNGYINQISSDLYPASGVSDDWMYGDTSTHNKIFAMTPEIGYAFWPSQSDIIPICKEMVFHNLVAARLIYNYAVVEDQSPQYIVAKNGDLDYNIKRVGLSGTGDFTVSIIPLSANIINIGPANNHNELPMLETIEGSISYELDNSIKFGDEFSYRLITNNGISTAEKTITKVFGTLTEIFYDPCDSNTDYWNESDWDLTIYDYYSNPSSITDTRSGGYINNTNKSIVLKNPIDLTNTQQAHVYFYAKWDIEADFDYVLFEVSIDNGLNWEAQCGQLTNIGKATQNEAEGKPLYDGEQPDWILEDININEYINEQVLFRFTLVSDNAIQGDGFYFDDLSVKTISTSAGINTIKEESFELYPNPVDKILNIKSETSNDLYCEIINTSGQLIKSENLTNSFRKINIEKLKKGLYFIKIQSKGNTIIKKFIKN